MASDPTTDPPAIERVAAAGYAAATRLDGREPRPFARLPAGERAYWIEIAEANIATWLFLQAGLILPPRDRPPHMADPD